MKTADEKPNYGNWVSHKFIVVPFIIFLVFCGLLFVHFIFFLPAIFFLVVAIYFAYSRYLFWPKGGNIQNQVRELLIQQLEWTGNGDVLDIGCGSGALTISLAQKFPDARIAAIDYWGKQWEYSKALCEKNAELEAVAGRIVFRKASAASLPFDDAQFDVVVSNLVFHEVGGVEDKTDLIREALRVLKKGGKFAFQDLFLWPRIYGKPETLLQKVGSWDVKDVKLYETNKSPFIPTILKLPFMLGTIAILAGEK